jgi:L-fuculose-phosphate aldolase
MDAEAIALDETPSAERTGHEIRPRLDVAEREGRPLPLQSNDVAAADQRQVEQVQEIHRAILRREAARKSERRHVADRRTGRLGGGAPISTQPLRVASSVTHATLQSVSERFAEARHDVWVHARKMWHEGLVVASAGNVSRRIDSELIAVTPTSISYEVMTPDEVVIVELATGRAVESSRAASYELPLHQVIYMSRPDVQAVVHTHSPFVTTLSVLRRPLPPVIDEMMMYFGGPVEVTDYAFTGTVQVGVNAVAALGDRAGVILSNHGNVCIGRDLARALHVAVTMESTARVYVQALAIGQPVPLPEWAIASGRRMYDERR